MSIANSVHNFVKRMFGEVLDEQLYYHVVLFVVVVVVWKLDEWAFGKYVEVVSRWNLLFAGFTLG